MAGHDEPRDPDAVPGEARPPAGARPRLAEAPSRRYRERTAERSDRPREGTPSVLIGPLARASVAAVVGAALLVFVGAILASTAGLLFVAGVTGAAAGLILSRAAVAADDGPAPVSRRRVAWIAVVVALGAVVVAAGVTWVVARQEGGTLGPIDYLLETFGPLIPAEAVVAAVAAWWGAMSGPVQR